MLVPSVLQWQPVTKLCVHVLSLLPQINTCIQEGVRLATLINNQAPVVTTDPVLAHLTAAHIEAAALGDTGSTNSTQPATSDSLVTSGSVRLCSLSCRPVWVAIVLVLLVLR